MKKEHDVTKLPKTLLDEPIFYIIMRTDLDSLGPGKAMAQANHAYGAVLCAISTKEVIQGDFFDWKDQTKQGFGITIVLAGTVHEIDTILYKAGKNANLVSGWVHDPTYPIADGDIIHVLPMDTCGFLFGERRDIKELTKDLELYSNERYGQY